MAQINITESLNTRDKVSNNKYDLLNYYNSLLFTSEQKIKLVEMLSQRVANEQLYKYLESVDKSLNEDEEDLEDVHSDLLNTVKNLLEENDFSEDGGYEYTVLNDTDDDGDYIVSVDFTYPISRNEFSKIFKLVTRKLSKWHIKPGVEVGRNINSVYFYPPIKEENESLTEDVEDEGAFILDDDIEYDGWFICPLRIDSIQIGDKEYPGYTRYLLRRKSDNAWLTDEYLQMLAKRAEVIKSREDAIDTVEKAKQVIDYINDRVVISERFTTLVSPVENK